MAKASAINSVTINNTGCVPGRPVFHKNCSGSERGAIACYAIITAVLEKSSTVL